jgi:hypothetical protein
LKSDVTAANFVNALEAANEELLAVTHNDTTNMDSAYAGWILEQFNTVGDPNLVRVLFPVPRRLR